MLPDLRRIPEGEVEIEVSPALKDAPEEVKHAVMTDLFLGLTDMLKHGVGVNIDDPNRIVLTGNKGKDDAHQTREQEALPGELECDPGNDSGPGGSPM